MFNGFLLNSFGTFGVVERLLCRLWFGRWECDDTSFWGRKSTWQISYVLVEILSLEDITIQAPLYTGSRLKSGPEAADIDF